MVAKCQTHQSRNYIQETLLNSIEIQIALRELIVEAKGSEVAVELTRFMKASVSKTWPARNSDVCEANPVMDAKKASKKIEALLDGHSAISNATDGTPGKVTQSSTLPQSSFGQTKLSQSRQLWFTWALLSRRPRGHLVSLSLPTTEPTKFQKMAPRRPAVLFMHDRIAGFVFAVCARLWSRHGNGQL